MKSKDIKTDGTVYAWAEPHSYGRVWPVTIAATGKEFRSRKIQVGRNLGDTTGGKQRQDGVEATVVEGGEQRFFHRDREPGYCETFSAREIVSTWAEHTAKQQAERERADEQRRRQDEARERGASLAARLVELGVNRTSGGTDGVRIPSDGLDGLEALLDRLDGQI